MSEHFPTTGDVHDWMETIIREKKQLEDTANNLQSSVNTLRYQNEELQKKIRQLTPDAIDKVELIRGYEQIQQLLFGFWSPNRETGYEVVFKLHNAMKDVEKICKKFTEVK